MNFLSEDLSQQPFVLGVQGTGHERGPVIPQTVNEVLRLDRIVAGWNRTSCSTFSSVTQCYSYNLSPKVGGVMRVLPCKESAKTTTNP